MNHKRFMMLVSHGLLAWRFVLMHATQLMSLLHQVWILVLSTFVRIGFIGLSPSMDRHNILQPSNASMT